jgi:flavin-dependent dehydrogenase
MVDEFDLPPEIIDRRVRKMKMISPSNVEVNIGSTLKDDEYIGMCRREVLDGFLRDRAAQLRAKLINGTVHTLEIAHHVRPGPTPCTTPSTAKMGWWATTKVSRWTW